MKNWSKSQLEKYIRATAKEGARIFLTEHARKQMRLRGISRQMMEETLQRGRLIRNPEISIKTGAWECRMERYVAGQNIGVVAAVSEQDPNLIIVTVMYVN